jgi:hypothetical protein
MATWWLRGRAPLPEHDPELPLSLAYEYEES